MSLTYTHELHRSDDPDAFTEPFAEVRKTRDRAWHGNYTLERQRVQDSIVEHFLKTEGVRAADGIADKPWVTFTSGGPGVGKSTAVQWMHAAGIFPLHRFVIVDPDAIRYQFPEWPAFVAEDPETAAARTHKEAGYIAELIQEEALRRGRSVLIDGTLPRVLVFACFCQPPRIVPAA
jgi:hypothetical protein